MLLSRPCSFLSLQVVNLLRSSEALCIACKEGNISKAERLLKTGAEVNAFGTGPLNDSGQPYMHGPPLALAIVCKHVDVVALLLEAGASPRGSTTDETAYLDHAVETDSLQMVEMLVSHDARSIESLQIAVGKGSVDIVKVLLPSGRKADSGSVGLSLCGAARLGHEAIVDLLLKAERGSQWNIPTYVWEHHLMTALESAAGDGHVAIVASILQADIWVPEYAARAIFPAIENGHGRVVRKVLELEKVFELEKEESLSVLRFVDPGDRTPVRLAVECGHEGVSEKHRSSLLQEI